MAKYFGHKPAWARPRASGFAPPPPPPSSGNLMPYGMPSGAMDGQIIPPNRGQYPRGNSLPGYGTPRAAMPFAASRNAAMRRMMMRGLLRRALSPIELAQMLDDFMSGEGWAASPSGWEWPAGWTKCPTPDCAGNVTHFQWAYSDGMGTLSSCSVQGSCPEGQAINTTYGVGQEPPVAMPFFPPRDVLYLVEETSPGLGTIRAQGVRPVNFGTGAVGVTELPEFRPGASMPLAVVNPMPRPVMRERSYPRPRVAPGGVPHVPVRNLPPVASRPPRPGDKEKKWILPTKSPLQKFWGALTEGMDAADCLEKAVRATGAKRKRGEDGRTGQVKFLARSLAQGHGDPGVFFACMAMDQAEDMLIGKVNQAATKAATKNPYWKRPVGPGFGGWGQRMR